MGNCQFVLVFLSRLLLLQVKTVNTRKNKELSTKYIGSVRPCVNLLSFLTTFVRITLIFDLGGFFFFFFFFYFALRLHWRPNREFDRYVREISTLFAQSFWQQISSFIMRKMPLCFFSACCLFKNIYTNYSDWFWRIKNMCWFACM